MAATNDQFECIDLTENDITKLEELPKLTRLETLLLANNKVTAIDPDFAEMCPKLDSIMLTNNRLCRLEDVDILATCKTLTRLSLLGNLVCNLPNYRLYTVHKIPSLRVLDFQMVTQEERLMAKKLFGHSEENLAVLETQKVVLMEEEDLHAAA